MKRLLLLLILIGNMGFAEYLPAGYTWMLDGGIHNQGKDTASINYTDVRTRAVTTTTSVSALYKPISVVGGYAGRFDGLTNSVTLNANPNQRSIITIGDTWSNINTNNLLQDFEPNLTGKPLWWTSASGFINANNYTTKNIDGCQIISDGTSVANISKSNVLTYGIPYRIELDVIITSGGLTVTDPVPDINWNTITASGKYQICGVASGNTIQIKRFGTTNAVIKSCYIYQTPIVSQFSSLGTINLGRWRSPNKGIVQLATGDIKQFITHDGLLPTADLIAIQQDFSLAYRNPAYAEHCDLWYWTSGNYVNQKGYYTAQNNGVTNVATQNPLAMSLGADNRGWVLNGTDQYLVMSTANYGDAGTNATWCFAFKTTDTNNGYLFSKRNNTVGEFSFIMDGAGTGGFQIYKGSKLLGSLTNRGLTNGKLKTVIVTYANPTFNVYIDGVYQGTTITDNAGIDGTIPSRLGTRDGAAASSAYLYGTIHHASKYPFVFDYARIRDMHWWLRSKYYFTQSSFKFRIDSDGGYRVASDGSYRFYE